jgi:hypothetical protein
MQGDYTFNVDEAVGLVVVRIYADRFDVRMVTPADLPPGDAEQSIREVCRMIADDEKPLGDDGGWVVSNN